MTKSQVSHWPEAGSHRGVRREPRGGDPGRGLSSPEWARGAVLYCVYPRAFSAEGTLDGVRRGLEAIRDLGASAIWLLPIHPSGRAGRKGPAGSPYAIRDYRALDPSLGSEDDFRKLVDEAHALGLRVIMDLVLNHAALDHPLGLAGGFHRDSRGRLTRRVHDWSDVADWNFQAPGVREHLLGAIEHWVGEFGIDGYRCDVAGMVPHDFWSEARERLLGLKPDHFLLAEWDDPELHRVAFHATYDWELYRALVASVRGVPAGRLSGILERRQSLFPSDAQPLRFVENHDEPRARRRFRGAAAAVTAFTALSGGVFLVYNGQETGAVHRPDLFGRDPIEWNKPGASCERQQLSALLKVRSDQGEGGHLTAITLAGDSRIVSYQRTWTDRRLVVTLNLSGHFVSLPDAVQERIATGVQVWPPNASPHQADALAPRSAMAWSVRP
jgi:glycosidase